MYVLLTFSKRLEDKVDIYLPMKTVDVVNVLFF